MKKNTFKGKNIDGKHKIFCNAVCVYIEVLAKVLKSFQKTLLITKFDSVQKQMQQNNNSHLCFPESKHHIFPIKLVKKQ